MPETPSMSIEEATRAITAPGQMFEMEDVEIRGVPTRVWKNCPRQSARGPGAVPGPRRHRLSRLRGRAHDLRGALPDRGRHRRRAARPLRRRARRPGRHRHAQPPRVGHGLLGRGRRRRRGGAAQRVVDEPRAPLRTGRLGDQGRLRRRGPARAPGTAPGRAPRPPSGRGHPRGPHRGTGHARRAGPRRLLHGAGGRPERRHHPARRDHRARRRRHHLLHVGHDREAQGCGGHAPQHGHQPDEPVLPQHPGRHALRRAAGARATGNKGVRAPTCCRYRCSTPRDATRSWWPTPRPATSS